MNKILIITDTIFTKRDYLRYGFDDIKKSFNLEFISVIKITNNKFFLQNKKNYQNKLNQKYFKSINELNFFLEKKNNIKLIIDFMSINKKNYSIRNIFKKSKIKILRYQTGTLPEKIYFRSTRKLIKDLNLLALIRKIYNYLYNLFIIKINYFIFDYILVCGLTADNKYSRNKIYAHSHDYEIYLRTKKNKNNQKKKIAVFLDEMVPDAPDYNLFGLKKPIKYKSYWVGIADILKKLEKKLKIKIVISLHPKNKKKNLYLKNFEIIKNQTHQLVNDCSLVIMHATTAINYAILNKKPVLFIKSENYSWLTDRINVFQKTINGPILNLEKNFNTQIDIKNIFKIDKIKYDEYIKNYIKHPLSKNKRLGELVRELALNL